MNQVERTVTVEWIGGPWDEVRFTLPEDQHTITVTHASGGSFELPVLRRGGWHYVVWVDPDGNDRGSPADR